MKIAIIFYDGEAMEFSDSLTGHKLVKKIDQRPGNVIIIRG
jgi:hypothetical protein